MFIRFPFCSLTFLVTFFVSAEPAYALIDTSCLAQLVGKVASQRSASIELSDKLDWVRFNDLTTKAQTSNLHPTEGEFRKKFPFNPLDPTQRQTLVGVPFENANFLVHSYDANSGRVTMFRSYWEQHLFSRYVNRRAAYLNGPWETRPPGFPESLSMQFWTSGAWRQLDEKRVSNPLGVLDMEHKITTFNMVRMIKLDWSQFQDLKKHEISWDPSPLKEKLTQILPYHVDIGPMYSNQVTMIEAFESVEGMSFNTTIGHKRVTFSFLKELGEFSADEYKAKILAITRQVPFALFTDGLEIISVTPERLMQYGNTGCRGLANGKQVAFSGTVRNLDDTSEMKVLFHELGHNLAFRLTAI